MPSLAEAQQHWKGITRCKSVNELQDSFLRADGSDTDWRSLRSVHWRTFLLFRTIDDAACRKTILSTRSAYDTLRSHFSTSDVNAATNNPLNEDLEVSCRRSTLKCVNLTAAKNVESPIG